VALAVVVAAYYFIEISTSSWLSCMKLASPLKPLVVVKLVRLMDLAKKNEWLSVS